MRKCKGVKSGERGRNSTFSHLPNQPFRNSYLVFYEYRWVLCAGEKLPPETIDVTLCTGQFHLGGMVLHLKEIYCNV